MARPSSSPSIRTPASPASRSIDPDSNFRCHVRPCTLAADADIQQVRATHKIGDGLAAYSSNGSINLANANNAIQAGISGVILQSGQSGSINFANSVDTTIFQAGGADANSNFVPNASIDILVSDPGRGTALSLTLAGVAQASGSITLGADGNVTLANGAALMGDNGDIVLAAGGNFINQAGSRHRFTGTGRWLIYSNDPADDTFGGLNSNNTAVFATTYPTAVSPPATAMSSPRAPTAHHHANDASKLYGTDASAALRTATPSPPSLSVGDFSQAFQPGGSDASFTGTPLVSSLGAGSSAGVGVYDIAVSLGSLQTSGYQLVFQNGHLTRDTGDPDLYGRCRRPDLYGAANWLFTGSIAGFVNGDTLAGATSGNLVFASSANGAAAWAPMRSTARG